MRENSWMVTGKKKFEQVELEINKVCSAFFKQKKTKNEVTLTVAVVLVITKDKKKSW